IGRSLILVSVLYVDLRRVFRFFFQAEDGIRDKLVTGVQTCALPIFGLGITRRREVLPVLLQATGVADESTRLVALSALAGFDARSEERRVGKEGRCRWGPDPEKKSETEQATKRCIEM